MVTFSNTFYRFLALNSHYMYHRNIWKNFDTKIEFLENRNVIKKWLHVVLLKRIFGGQSDSILAQIRNAFINEDDKKTTQGIKISEEITLFPYDRINDQIRRDTSVGDDFIDELLKTQKDDRYSFSILALLYPNLDYKNNNFHKDHLHPISSFQNKETIKLFNLTDEDMEYYSSPEWNNSIVNLQMLDANENLSKQDKPLKDWLESQSKELPLANFREKLLIPNNVSLDLSDFKEFILARHQLLKEKIKDLLS